MVVRVSLVCAVVAATVAALAPVHAAVSSDGRASHVAASADAQQASTSPEPAFSGIHVEDDTCECRGAAVVDPLPRTSVPFPLPQAPGENPWPAWSCDDDDETRLGLDGQVHVPVARNATRAWTAAAEAVGIAFQDGGRSIHLAGNPNGKDGEVVALWTFGDTIPTPEHGGPWFKNTGMVVRRRLVPPNDTATGAPGMQAGKAAVAAHDGHHPMTGDVVFRYVSTPNVTTRGSPGSAACIVPFNETMAPQAPCNASGLWPASGVTVDDTVFIYFQVVRDKHPDILGVARTPLAPLLTNGAGGAEIAVEWVSDDLPFLGEQALEDPADPNALFVLFSRPGDNGRYPYVARVHKSAAAVGNVSAYRYWRTASAHGHGHIVLGSDDYAGEWVSDFERSTSVAPHLAVAQISAAWNEYLQRYVMFSSGSWEDARKVFVSTAPHPWGPWSERTIVYHLEGPMGDGFSGSIYCAYVHPELSSDLGRRMYFSYSLIPRAGSSDAPHLVELTLCTEDEAEAHPAACLGGPYAHVNASAPTPPTCPQQAMPMWGVALCALAAGFAMYGVCYAANRYSQRQTRKRRSASGGSMTQERSRMFDEAVKERNREFDREHSPFVNTAPYKELADVLGEDEDDEEEGGARDGRPMAGGRVNKKGSM